MIKITITNESIQAMKGMYNSIGSDLQEKELMQMTEKDLHIPELKSKGLEIVNTSEGDTIIIKTELIEKVFEVYAEYIPQIISMGKSFALLFKNFAAKFSKIEKEFLTPIEEKKENDQEAK